MKIDTLTKIKILSLKAVTGFLCAFFPLYIAQYLSYHIFMFPMNLIVGIILLIPFFFLAKFLWKTINAYYLLVIFERTEKEVNEAENSVFNDYDRDNNIVNKEEPEVTKNELELQIEQQYNNIINYTPGFTSLKINQRNHHIALNERYYLLEEAHNDIKTVDEKVALFEFRQQYEEHNRLTELRIQLKKDIDRSDTSAIKLKQDFISMSQKINYIDSQILKLEKSQEIVNILNRVFVTLSGKTKDQLTLSEIYNVHQKMEETGLIKSVLERYREELKED